MEGVSIATAFLAGLLSFLSPCLVPLLPAYFGLLVGEVGMDRSDKKMRMRVFKAALAYVLGFSVVFWLMGVSANALGRFITANSGLLQQIGGIVVLMFGLHIMGILRFASLDKGKKLHVPEALRNIQIVGPFLIGVAFAFGWTPCFGPVLGSILLLASMQETLFMGGFLLLVYALGIAIPFLVIALIWGNVAVFIKHTDHVLQKIHMLGGLFLVVLGILMVTGYLDILNAWTFEYLLEWMQPVFNHT